MIQLTPQARSYASSTATSSARTRPSAPWPWPCATATAAPSCRAEIREEVTPKNILMVGPTGVGKTEIARRLAKLVDAPFVKVEATKFTEVGYVGRDVESIVRDLVEASIRLVKEQHTARVHAARRRPNAEERLVDLIVKPVKKKTNPIDILLGNKPKEPELPPRRRKSSSPRRVGRAAQQLRSGRDGSTCWSRSKWRRPPRAARSPAPT